MSDHANTDLVPHRLQHRLGDQPHQTSRRGSYNTDTARSKRSSVLSRLEPFDDETQDGRQDYAHNRRTAPRRVLSRDSPVSSIDFTDTRPSVLDRLGDETPVAKVAKIEARRVTSGTEGLVTRRQQKKLERQEKQREKMAWKQQQQQQQRDAWQQYQQHHYPQWNSYGYDDRGRYVGPPQGYGSEQYYQQSQYQPQQPPQHHQQPHQQTQAQPYHNQYQQAPTSAYSHPSRNSASSPPYTHTSSHDITQAPPNHGHPASSTTTTTYAARPRSRPTSRSPPPSNSSLPRQHEGFRTVSHNSSLWQAVGSQPDTAPTSDTSVDELLRCDSELVDVDKLVETSAQPRSGTQSRTSPQTGRNSAVSGYDDDNVNNHGNGEMEHDDDEEDEDEEEDLRDVLLRRKAARAKEQLMTQGDQSRLKLPAQHPVAKATSTKPRSSSVQSPGTLAIDGKLGSPLVELQQHEEGAVVKAPSFRSPLSLAEIKANKLAQAQSQAQAQVKAQKTRQVQAETQAQVEAEMATVTMQAKASAQVEAEMLQAKEEKRIAKKERRRAKAERRIAGNEAKEQKAARHERARQKADAALRLAVVKERAAAVHDASQAGSTLALPCSNPESTLIAQAYLKTVETGADLPADSNTSPRLAHLQPAEWTLSLDSDDDERGEVGNTSMGISNNTGYDNDNADATLNISDTINKTPRPDVETTSIGVQCSLLAAPPLVLWSNQTPEQIHSVATMAVTSALVVLPVEPELKQGLTIKPKTSRLKAARLAAQRLKAVSG